MPAPDRTARAARPDVLVLAKYYHPYNGGIENSTKVFCEGMLDRHSVKVIAFNHEPGFARDMVNGVEVERHHVQCVIKSQPISIGYLIATVRQRAKITHFHAPNVVASLALAFRRSSRLISIHHMDIFGRPRLRQIARGLYDRVLRHTDLLVVTSLKNAKVSADLRVPVATEAVPLGIDVENYTLAEPEREAARRWRRELAGDAPLVGFVGRHARYKGLDVLVRSLARLPGVHAAIAGNGPYREEAEALAASLGIADRVHFLGEISHAEKLRLLAGIDVFAFPSTEITEAFGISQLEAMLLGAAVAGSELPTGVTDIAVNDVTALTATPGDEVGFAEVMRRLLEDDVLRETLARNARQHVLDNFTTERMVSRFNTLNDRVLALPAAA